VHRRRWQLCRRIRRRRRYRHRRSRRFCFPRRPLGTGTKVPPWLRHRFPDRLTALFLKPLFRLLLR
jgi:hypothetical protein